MSNTFIIERIQSQLMASGKNAIILNSILPNETNKKKNTMKLQIYSTKSKSSDNELTTVDKADSCLKAKT